MKKKFMLCVPVLALGLLTSGCGNTKVLECTKTESEDGMEMSEVMKMTYKKDELTKMDMSMKMTVEDEYKDYLAMYAGLFESQFSYLEDTKGVTLNTKTDDNKLTVDIVVDITKVDDETKEEFASDATTYDEAKKYYEEDGYTCK